MKKLTFEIFIISFFIFIIPSLIYAGTWTDNFSGEALSPLWHGDTANFSISNGLLNGRNAHPILLIPLRWIEIGKDWDDYTVQCKINVVTPNLLVCTKGALILRNNGKEGYVFALHVATRTVEVYRLSNEEMLLKKEIPLELEKWYLVRAELQGENMAFFLDNQLIGKITDNKSVSGTVGLAVQDVLSVLFDDFTITGPKIEIASAITRTGKTIPITWGNIKLSFHAK